MAERESGKWAGQAAGLWAFPVTTITGSTNPALPVLPGASLTLQLPGKCWHGTADLGMELPMTVTTAWSPLP